jgi:hypothetical protein
MGKSSTFNNLFDSQPIHANLRIWNKAGLALDEECELPVQQPG